MQGLLMSGVYVSLSIAEKRLELDGLPGSGTT